MVKVINTEFWIWYGLLHIGTGQLEVIGCIMGMGKIDKAIKQSLCGGANMPWPHASCMTHNKPEHKWQGMNSIDCTWWDRAVTFEKVSRLVGLMRRYRSPLRPKPYTPIRPRPSVQNEMASHPRHHGTVVVQPTQSVAEGESPRNIVLDVQPPVAAPAWRWPQNMFEITPPIASSSFQPSVPNAPIVSFY